MVFLVPKLIPFQNGYPHNDTTSLRTLLSRVPSERKDLSADLVLSGRPLAASFLAALAFPRHDWFQKQGESQWAIPTLTSDRRGRG